jgi:hypothetical protein
MNNQISAEKVLLSFLFVNLSLFSGQLSTEANISRLKDNQSFLDQSHPKINLDSHTQVTNETILLSKDRREGNLVSRDVCAIEEGYPLPMMALVPPETLGLIPSSTSAHPTFWVYSPYAVSSDSESESLAKFAIYDVSDPEQGDAIFETDIANISPGITEISLPDSAPDLVAGHEYEWFFEVYCDDTSPDYVIGSVALVGTPDSTEEPWYDRITDVARRLRDNPNDSSVRTEWQTLLEEIDLNTSQIKM